MFSFITLRFGLIRSLSDEFKNYFDNDLNVVALYSEFIKYLQVLSANSQPEHWILKSPMHGLWIQTFNKSFPDALYIMTNRDLPKAISSTSSLMLSINKIYEKNFNKNEIGEKSCGIKKIFDSIDNFKQELKEKERWIDVNYRDLLIDPTIVIKKIYDQFGLQYTNQFEEKMKKWLQVNPQHVSGKHTHDLKDFGLDEKKFN